VTADELPDVPQPSARARELACLIQQHVDRFVDDDAADPDDLAEFLDRLPRQERARVVRAAFEALPSQRQWEVLEAVFGDAEIAEYLCAEHERRRAWLAGEASLVSLVEDARSRGSIDLASVVMGTEVVLGLFRSGDVAAAADRGPRSDVCARRVVLRVAAEHGELRVIEDTFNPRGGLFVTPEYDAQVWQSERWPSHTLVRVGAIGPAEELEPVLFPGARLDAEYDARVHRGRLHLGFALIGGHDVFTGVR
jgi:hypothetical protein